MKVLVVEDDPLHASYLREAVRGALPGLVDIVEARDGVEGERLAREPGCASVVMDLQMSRRTGIEAARTIWAERPATRILFWSNYSDEAYVRGISRIVPKEAAYGYVLKTASGERLKLALRAIFLEAQIVIDREVHQIQHARNRPERGLTEAEHAVLVDAALGLTDRCIARRQHLSLRSVQNRLRGLYDKLEVLPEGDDLAPGDFNQRSRAVARALQRRILNPQELERAEVKLQAWLRGER
ncbi:response regulator transcription factor (plasmid) [Paroceanicella profunda]|uniref:Response regulator transcription factor n=1 Tax=Paroceanicella profunda TaxID=2579971 RepID=A0A5B8FJN4_9RHOB|nr:response regulator transcription factor [Paroceanicella profunda]QDL94528.1 response regulator transcription factor [Paroceanicella profunda]